MSITINEWDEVRFIEHAASRPVLFGGFVESVRVTPWAAGGRMIEVEVVGYGILLDRKVVDSFDGQDVDGDMNIHVAPNIVALINRFGGRVTGTANGNAKSRNTYITDTQHSIAYSEDWWWQAYPAGGLNEIGTPTMLRSVLDAWSEASSDIALGPLIGQPAIGTGMTYWVDGYARLHAHPLLDEAVGGAANENYDGNCPVAITEGVPSASVVNNAGVGHERENMDLLTRVYVVGANANGTGFVGRGGHERAGDLETIVNQPLSTTAGQKQAYGDGVIAVTTASVARDSAVVEAAAPIDFRPCQRLLVTSTPLELSAQPFRIMNVGITFHTAVHRTYTVKYGGSLAPSLSQRTGRYQVISRGS